MYMNKGSNVSHPEYKEVHIIILQLIINFTKNILKLI
jgi:hypothetical protein